MPATATAAWSTRDEGLLGRDQLRERRDRRGPDRPRGGTGRDKRPIDALTSNVGHCLWTGIAAEDKAPALAERPLSPEMFSGWGIRTLGASMGAYNPMSYHNGSVWPHDTGLCVAGLARTATRRRLASSPPDWSMPPRTSATRLPELFAGFPRDDVPVPVPYPAACAPQAWASAAPLEMLRALLRLEPDGPALTCAPALPARFLPLALRNLAHRGERFDIEVDTTGWSIRRSEP